MTRPQSAGDALRCALSLAAWLWPVPAVAVGLALRRVDPAVQEGAALDGGRRGVLRVTAGLVAPAAVAGFAAAFALAAQEFSVYDATGVSVVATEVRMVYETGAFLDGRPADVGAEPRPAEGEADAADPMSQPARAAAALAVGLPLLLVTLGAAAVAASLAWRQADATAGDVGLGGTWPRTVDAGAGWTIGAWGVVAVALGVPVAAMLASLSRPFDPVRVWDEVEPQATAALLYAGSAGLIGLALAALAAVRRSGAATVIGLGAFLIGGQLLAVGLIRLYNRPGLFWVYDGPVAVLADVGRFAWVALAVGGATWGGSLRPLRDAASADGATAGQAARLVVWPVAWPMLAAGAVLVALLSLTEVPAAALLAPPTLVPMMLTWVHIARFDPMIEASLLLVIAVVLGSAVVAGLAVLARRRATIRSARRVGGTLAVALVCLTLTGCPGSAAPDAVWGTTGRLDGQLVYPRAIAYAPADDSFFVVDRTARVQHWDGSGRFLNGWSMPANAQGKPVGVSVGPDGNVWVPDTHYHRVIVYTPDGVEVRRFGSVYSGEGDGFGEFLLPTDVGFDAAGRVFVSEYGGHDRIQVFTPAGEFLYAFGSFGGGDGQFNRPQSIAVVGDRVYVTDACNHRIVVFSTDGKWLGNLGELGGGPGQFRFPYGLAVDEEGNLIVCEFGNNRVQRIDPRTGESLGTWGSPGRGEGEMAYPWAVAVDGSDRVVAVDAGNNRLQVFRF